VLEHVVDLIRAVLASAGAGTRRAPHEAASFVQHLGMTIAEYRKLFSLKGS
jgi:hypothetical protein